MPDEKATVAATSDDRIKAAASGLKAVLDVLAPAPKDEEAGSSSSTKVVVDELYGALNSTDIADAAKGARTAVDRYRNAMRWLVGAVAGIGVVLFGSTAFTNGNPFDSGHARVGLALAALGLVLILTAATLVFEPEDASLGELSADIRRAKEKTFNKWGWWHWLKLRLSPRLLATLRLAHILEGEEAYAHLGPNHGSVDDLIKSIGRGERRRVNAAKDLAHHRDLMAANAAKRELAFARFDELLKTRAGIDIVKAGYGPTLNVPLAGLISTTTNLRVQAEAEYDLLATKQETLRRRDYQLGLDLLHRDLVLLESGVAQLRGTFRLSRRLLLLGALLTLLGALLYVVGVKENDAADTPASQVRSGTLVVKAGTKSADKFTQECIGTELSVVYFKEETPGLTDKYDIVVSDPEECAGTYTIPAGRAPEDADLSLKKAVDVPEESDDANG